MRSCFNVQVRSSKSLRFLFEFLSISPVPLPPLILDIKVIQLYDRIISIPQLHPFFDPEHFTSYFFTYSPWHGFYLWRLLFSSYGRGVYVMTSIFSFIFSVAIPLLSTSQGDLTSSHGWNSIMNLLVNGAKQQQLVWKELRPPSVRLPLVQAISKRRKRIPTRQESCKLYCSISQGGKRKYIGSRSSLSKPPSPHSHAILLPYYISTFESGTLEGDINFKLDPRGMKWCVCSRE